MRGPPDRVANLVALLRLALLAQLVVIPHLARAACPVVLPQPPESRRLEPRVIGGIPAPPVTRSFLAALLHPNDTFACTASLLSSRWLLTAAHCSVQLDWRARIAADHPGGGTAIPIRAVFVHPSYVRDAFDHPGDLALVQLAIPAPPWATFVSVNDMPSFPAVGAFARTVGYGWRNRKKQDPNPHAHQVDAPVNSPVKCRNIYASSLSLRSFYFICVGYGRNACEADSCNGDSGGPLVQYDPLANPIQIGVVSFGMKCGENGVPGVYARLSSYIDWLTSVGADFTVSSDAVATYAAGSEEAASDQFTTTLQADPFRRPGTVLVSRVWFICLCVVAAVAVLALILVSFAFVFTVRRLGRNRLPTDFPDLNGPPSNPAEQENLNLAISLLRGLSRPSDPVRPSEGGHTDNSVATESAANQPFAHLDDSNPSNFDTHYYNIPYDEKHHTTNFGP